MEAVGVIIFKVIEFAVKYWKFVLPAILALMLWGAWALYQYEKNQVAVFKGAAIENAQTVIELENQAKIASKDVTAAIKLQQDNHTAFDKVRKVIASAPASADGPVPQVVLDTLKALKDAGK